MNSHDPGECPEEIWPANDSTCGYECEAKEYEAPLVVPKPKGLE